MPKTTKFAKLRGRMIELGYTYNIMAKKLNVSMPTLSNKLNGKADWRHNEMCQIIKILGIKDDEINSYFFFSA